MMPSIDWIALAGQLLSVLVATAGAGVVGWALGRRKSLVEVAGVSRARVSDSLMGEPGGDLTKVQSFNQLVRSIITLTLCGTVVAGFFLGKISADFIMGLASGALSYWFARDTQSAATKESVALLQTPPPVGPGLPVTPEPTKPKV